jgi:hypothetical protein
VQGLRVLHRQALYQEELGELVQQAHYNLQAVVAVVAPPAKI